MAQNRPKSNKSKSSALNTLLSFLEEQLPRFEEETDMADLQENDITEKLYHFLVQKKPNNFYFTMQANQEGRRTSDLGASLYGANNSYGFEYFFCLEAKFLPSYDYVTGEYAAIKRFKANEHGINNKYELKRLPQNGIVAYVKDLSNSENLKKINDKIETLNKAGTDEFGLTWSESEKLHSHTQYPNREDIYQSEHLRISGEPLTLHHFWVYVTDRNS